MASEPLSITRYQAIVAIVVGCITIATFISTVFGYFKAGELKDLQQDIRIGTAETNLGEVKETMKDLTAETRELTKVMVRLTTVIEGKPVSDRAQLERPLFPPMSIIGTRVE